MKTAGIMSAFFVHMGTGNNNHNQTATCWVAVMPQGFQQWSDLTARRRSIFVKHFIMKAIQKLSALLTLWLDEKVTPRQTFGVLSASIGTVLIFASGSTVCLVLALVLLAISVSPIIQREKGGEV